MGRFQVLILPIDKVEDHPKADRLSLNHIRGYVAVSNKKEDGSHRYRAGQLVAYVPEGAVIPDSLLKRKGYWDEEKGKGFLSGDKGNVVKAINLRNVLSQGLIFPCQEEMFETVVPEGPHAAGEVFKPTDSLDRATVINSFLQSGDGHKRIVQSGDDVMSFLGIYPRENHFLKVTDNSQIKIMSPVAYEVEDLKKFPDLIKGPVIVTEMLHGILCIIGYNRTLEDPWVVSSGPMTRVGFQLTKEQDNIYTQTAIPIWKEIERYLKEMPGIEEFYLFGVIIGPGIQDLTYGLEQTEFRAIDVTMKFMGATGGSIRQGFVGVRKYELFKWMNIATVPVLSGGEFDMATMKTLVKEPSAIGGGIRKGIVITAEDENPVDGMRPILKLLSDKFLLRNNATDYK